MTEQRLTADIAARVRNLLRTCDVAAGLILHAADNLCGFEQVVGGTGIQPDEIPVELFNVQLTAFHVLDIDIRNLQLASCRGLESAGDLHNRVIVEIQTRNDIVRLRIARLLLDGNSTALIIKLHNAERTRVIDIVAEYAGAGFLLHSTVQTVLEIGGIEDIIAQNKANRVIPDELGADEQRVRDAACNLLHLVGDVDAEAAAGTEQTVERAFLSGRDDDENIADTGLQERSQRIVDHRFIVYRQQRFAYRTCHRVQARALTGGKNDSFHWLFLYLYVFVRLV